MSRGHLTAQLAPSLCVGEPPGLSVGGVGFLLLPSSLSLPGALLAPVALESGPCLPQSGSRRNCSRPSSGPCPPQLQGELPALGADQGRKRKRSRAMGRTGGR